MGSPGAPHAFNVTAVDQDGRFVGPNTQGRIVVAVVAIPDPRADVGNVSQRFVAVAQTTIEDPGGPHRVVASFTPEVAGSYVVEAIFLRPDEVWDPVANVSDYTGLASGQKVEVRRTCGLCCRGACQRAGGQQSTGYRFRTWRA